MWGKRHGDTRRAAAHFAWTRPLRPLRERHARLSAACFRLGGVALAGVIAVPLLLSREGAAAAWMVNLVALTLFIISAVSFYFARKSEAEVERLESEITRIEAEAEEHLQ